ncbi:hypothetical protein [Erythrobacter sp. JK5]|uniref:hypothetical protein n=1 Tax=Erythrobacter sp. JK5 TaxID=2829500 RepID=UPI001BA56E22|nr:hypothetical protein [Erythrobacter sp. JK5]QUL36437.1 hypothetical protein KDC96_08220 [Erythrobacter sp. JK5]
MDLVNAILLSSDAAILADVGTGFLLLAAFCALMERRRGKSRSLERLERVGWVPWTGLFVGCMIIGGGCLAMSLPVVLGNL